ncbi:MAG: hypothetical protein WBW55_13775 [Desulfobaccales bacterium]
MKYVEFYELKDAKYEKIGEVRLVGIGSDVKLEFHGSKADVLRHTLEEIPVYDHSVMPNVPYYPSTDDKEKYLSLLPQGFCGSYFRASAVLTR